MKRILSRARWLALVLVCACHPVPAADPVSAVQDAIAETVTATVVAARELVEPILPAAPASVSGECPAAIDLIVQFEVVSAAYYRTRLEWPIWPGAASGVTWGIGYDGGHQTRQRIREDWWMHQARDELSQTSGITGIAARDLSRSLRHIRTELELAQQVFADVTLPRYDAMAARAFRNGWDALPACARGALLSLVFNRGSLMTGDRRREMRVIRDECVPRGDVHCIAGQLRAMTRIWAGTDIDAGMRRRRTAEADLALRGNP